MTTVLLMVLAGFVGALLAKLLKRRPPPLPTVLPAHELVVRRDKITIGR